MKISNIDILSSQDLAYEPSTILYAQASPTTEGGDILAVRSNDGTGEIRGGDGTSGLGNPGGGTAGKGNFDCTQHDLNDYGRLDGSPEDQGLLDGTPQGKIVGDNKDQTTVGGNTESKTIGDNPGNSVTIGDNSGNSVTIGNNPGDPGIINNNPGTLINNPSNVSTLTNNLGNSEHNCGIYIEVPSNHPFIRAIYEKTAHYHFEIDIALVTTCIILMSYIVLSKPSYRSLVVTGISLFASFLTIYAFFVYL